MATAVIGARGEFLAETKAGDVVIAGGLRMQQVADDLVSHCKVAAKEAGLLPCQGVWIVFEDGNGNELAVDKYGSAAGIWLKAARGKIAGLKAAGDEVEKMNIGPPFGLPKLTASLCGLVCCGKKEFPVRGAAVVSYDDPDVPGKRLTGHLSVSGCPTPGGDVAIVSKALSRMPHTQNITGKVDAFEVVRVGDVEGFSPDAAAKFAGEVQRCPPAFLCSLVCGLPISALFILCLRNHINGVIITLADKPAALIPTLVMLLIYAVVFAVLLVRFPSTYLPAHKGLMCCTSVFLASFSICVLIHYIRYNEDR